MMLFHINQFCKVGSYMKYSIIVPVYNVEQYLDCCVQSLIRQTFSDFEVILVDDGSSDSSGKKCDVYAQQDLRIKTIHKKNGGLSSARNVGMRIASGEYFIFIDSDDYVDIKLLSSVDVVVSRVNPDLVQFKNHTFIDGQGIENNNISENYEVLEGRKNIFDGYIHGLVTRTAWNKVYRRELFLSIQYPEGRLAEDLATTYKLLELCNSVVCMDSELYFYRVRTGSIMGTGSMKLYYDVMLGHYENLVDSEWKHYKTELATAYYNNLMKAYAKSMIEHEDKYRLELRQRLGRVNYGDLQRESKIVYCAFKLIPNRTLKFIYRRYVQGAK